MTCRRFTPTPCWQSEIIGLGCQLPAVGYQLIALTQIVHSFVHFLHFTLSQTSSGAES